MSKTDRLPDLSRVTWLHTNVSAWPVTSNLRVTLGPDTITFDFDKTKVWPPRYDVNANPWVILRYRKKWYAATFEWLRPGIVWKWKTSVAGDHIKRAPLTNWKPRKGQKLWFMVSGLARDANRNVEERTNVVAVTWE